MTILGLKVLGDEYPNKVIVIPPMSEIKNNNIVSIISQTFNEKGYKIDEKPIRRAIKDWEENLLYIRYDKENDYTLYTKSTENDETAIQFIAKKY